MSNKCSYSTLGAAQRGKKTVRSVAVGGKSPKLHLINVSQGTHKIPQEDLHIYLNTMCICEITTCMSPAVRAIS